MAKFSGVTQQQARSPTQPSADDEVSLVPWKNSGEIEEDLQTGRITERYLIPGDPSEARVSALLQGFGNANFIRMEPHPHQWYKDAFLVSRSFKHHVQNDTTAERRTMLTLVYQKRPCPFAWEEEDIGTLVSTQMWWSGDDPPKPLSGSIQSVVGISTMMPQRLLKRRYPNVRMSAANVELIRDQLGNTNKIDFAGKKPDVWLFHDFRAKMLHGDFNGNAVGEAHWEMTFFFRGDPIRKHMYWTPKAEGGVLVRPFRQFDLTLTPDRFYNISRVFPQASGGLPNWNFVPRDVARCSVGTP